MEGSRAGPGYSIRVVSRLTGLSADTLRMWERRYGFPKPRRNDSGVRVYSDAEIERLSLISRALKAGYRAGEVVDRETTELQQLLTTSAETRKQVSTASTPTVDTILDCLRRDDASAIRNELRQAVALMGPKQFVVEVASELVTRVGDEWEAGRLRVRHEHLLSEALSTQLRLLLSAYEGQRGGPVVLLTALSQELHALGLEMVALYCAVSGATPRLLGVDTPADQIVEAAQALGVDVVGISLSRATNSRKAMADLRWILEHLPADLEVWLGGEAAGRVDISHPRLVRTSSWQELESRLEVLRSRKR